MGDHKSYDGAPEDKLEWNNNSRKSKRSQGVSEDKKLELKLGPPGDDDHQDQSQSQSLLSHHLHQASNYNNNHNHIEAKRVFEGERNWLSSKDTNNYCQNLSSYYNNNYSCNIDHNKVEKVFATHQCSYASSLPSPLSSFQCDKSQWLHQQHPKPSIFIPSPCTTTTATATASKFPNSAAANCCSKKRTAHAHAWAAVVGWPPVRSFRKNLGNGNFISKTNKPPDDVNDQSEKTSMVLQEGGNSDITIHHDVRKCEATSENDRMFVKINMEGVPIGRKVDLKAYDSYHKLSCAVDQLFRDLVSKQRALNHQYCLHSNYNANANANNGDQYTLVYEDNEGDSMLVGDVPWQMFVSTAKRLRVLKSSQVSTLRRIIELRSACKWAFSVGSSQDEKTPLDDATMEIAR